jgi:hypothetical protein
MKGIKERKELTALKYSSLNFNGPFLLVLYWSFTIFCERSYSMRVRLFRPLSKMTLKMNRARPKKKMVL